MSHKYHVIATSPIFLRSPNELNMKVGMLIFDDDWDGFHRLLLLSSLCRSIVVGRRDFFDPSRSQLLTKTETIVINNAMP